ncbi:MAG: transcriptional repressor LexA [Endomicrobiales bacterium]
MEQLTGRQKEIVDFISEFVSDHGRTPTVREIARRFSISIGPVQRHLKALIKKGHLKHTPGISRGLELSSRLPLVAVPVLGRVAAGIPLEALESVEEYVHVGREALKGGDCFALKVKGDSMTGSGILEGDVVVVRKQPSAENGDIVVAMIEGEGAVKKLRRQEGGTWLESTNPRYKPLRVKEITVLGKVVYLVRKYRS